MKEPLLFSTLNVAKIEVRHQVPQNQNEKLTFAALKLSISLQMLYSPMIIQSFQRGILFLTNFACLIPIMTFLMRYQLTVEFENRSAMTLQELFVVVRL